MISVELQCSLFSWIRSNWCGWIFFICEPRLGSSTKKLKFTTIEGFEPPILRFGSRHPFRWAVETFPILFRYSQWINWSVKWPSMCSVVSLLLPSFVLWVMMVSWLHFFRLGARLGSSTSFRHCIQKFNHRGIRTPNLLIRSQTPYPLGYAAWWGLYHFCFFFCNEWLRWGVKWHTVLAIVSLCQSFSLLEIDICWAPVYFVWLKQDKLMWLDLFHCEPRLGSWTNKLNFTTADEFEPSIFRLESRHPLGLEDFPISVSLQSMNQLKCKVALDALCRLTLTIFRPPSEWW